ncbi:hypothetical protein ANO11243_022670 [Dothideomycetidae sp. 11243]|nr:hypothetical protein ANO11243_022670 [fungal sp. No.11243]
MGENQGERGSRCRGTLSQVESVDCRATDAIVAGRDTVPCRGRSWATWGAVDEGTGQAQGGRNQDDEAKQRIAVWYGYGYGETKRCVIIRPFFWPTSALHASTDKHSSLLSWISCIRYVIPSLYRVWPKQCWLVHPWLAA